MSIPSFAPSADEEGKKTSRLEAMRSALNCLIGAVDRLAYLKEQLTAPDVCPEPEKKLEVAFKSLAALLHDTPDLLVQFAEVIDSQCKILRENLL